MAKPKSFSITNMILSAATGLIFLTLTFLAITGHWDLMGIIGAVLTVILLPLSIILMDFIRRFERKEGRRIRNASMAGQEDFIEYVMEQNKRILKKRESMSDADALQRVIDFNKRKGFEQLNEIDSGFLRIMIPASLVVFCISLFLIFTMEWPGNILLTVVSLWTFIICLELRSMTRHQETIIRLLQAELDLMRKEDRLAILSG